MTKSKKDAEAIGKDILDSRVLSFVGKTKNATTKFVQECVMVPTSLDPPGLDYGYEGSVTHDNRLISNSLKRLRKAGKIDLNNGVWELVRK
jgi:hypothetical protein